ncbi:MAG: DUF2029 domain-containing protein [Planctomycetes bacterium]|nr:DUF2029 domain-containing protein [Planctomycetota bacterium]
MSIGGLSSWWGSRTRWEQIAIAVWAAFLLFVCVRTFVKPAAKTVYPIYSACGYFWWHGIDLYAPDRPEWAQGGYRYSPTFAVMCVPFAAFPDSVGGVLWRLVCTGGFLGSLWWLARTASSKPLTADQLSWLMLLSLPLSMQSVSNGQANILIAATLVGSIAAVREERWNLVSVLVAVAFACKVYPLALGLLLVVLYPRALGWRIPLGVLASLIAPFLAQTPDYVIDQYAKWLNVLRTDDRSAIDLDQSYRDLWLLIRLYDLPVHRLMYVAIQMLTALGLACFVWHRQRSGWAQKPLLISTLALASAWMMLLGPTTESCSFILMAASFAWSIVEALRDGASKARCWMLGLSAAFFVSAVALADFKWLINIHAVGVHSWACVFYLGYLLTEPHPEVEPAAEQRLPLAA